MNADAMANWVIWIYASFLGAAVGSFLNVVVYRLPAGESVVSPGSHCPVCGYALRWYDNVPLLSYALLRGRCRSCQTGISVQYPLVELGTALLWLASALRFIPTETVVTAASVVEALHSAVLLTLLLGIALTDAREMVIPDQLSLGGVLLGVLFAVTLGWLSGEWGIPVRSVIGAIGAYILMLAIELGGARLFGKPALGRGDVHMMAMVGAFLGPAGAILTLFLGSLLGLLIGIPYSWLKGTLGLGRTYLPLGVFLALGAAVAHAWGAELIDWYLSSIVGAF